MVLHGEWLRPWMLVCVCMGVMSGEARAAGPVAVPLVVPHQDQGQHGGRAGAPRLHPLRASNDDDDADVEDDGADREGTGRRWFALWLPDDPRPELEDKSMLIVIFGTLFGMVGGSVWAPIVFAGATFDLEWALPSIVYNLVALGCLVAGVLLWAFPYVGWYLGWIAFLAMNIVAWGFVWLAVQTALANLNRPEIELRSEKALGGGKSGKSPKARGKARRPKPRVTEDDDNDNDEGQDADGG